MRRLPAALLAASISLGILVAPSVEEGIAAAGVAAHPHAVTTQTPVKGIAVTLGFANRLTDAKAMSMANTLMSFIANTLHANAVSLNFPFWQRGSLSSDPMRQPMTSSPQRLTEFTAIAHRYHLMVQWRPYLYEGDLKFGTHNSITPTYPARWLNNYWTFLKPYLIAANLANAYSFSIALELRSMLPYLTQWTTIVAKAKTLFSGQILYSQQHRPQVTIPLTARGYDAYQPIHLASRAQVSVAAFTKGFENNLRDAAMQSSPADLTLEEVSIPATKIAYLEPAQFHLNKTTKLDRPVQTDWFMGACNAFYALHLQGIYYYGIAFDRWSPRENQSKSIFGWLKTPTQNAIASCFARPPSATPLQPQGGTPPVNWDPTTPIEGTGGHPTAASCPTPTFCAVIDHGGDVVTDVAGSWSAPTQISQSPLVTVSCGSSTFCVALDDVGYAYYYDGTAWTASTNAVDSIPMGSISCVDTTCTAVDVAGRALRYTSGAWSVALKVARSPLTAVSCATAIDCVAVDASGNAYSTSGPTWSGATTLGSSVLTSLACPTTSFCLAGDDTGRLYRDVSGSWQSPVASGLTGGIAAVACASATNCVAAGGDGATSVRPDGSLFPLLHLFPSDAPVALTCAPGSLCTALSYGGLATFRSSSWNAAKRIDARPGLLTAVACGSSTFCMAVDDAGRASLWNGTGWAAPIPTGVNSLSAISCAGGFCQAVSVTGQVTTYQGGIWQAAHRIDPDALTGVSCVTAHFCAAVDASKRVLTFNGLKWSKPRTMGVNQQTVRGYVAVSCATATFCVAVSTDGEELFFGDGAAFLFQADTPFVPLTGVSCASPTFCVAVDEQGRVLTYTESAGVPHWSRPRVIDAYRLTGVSCTSSGSCLASDDQGGTVAYVNGAWTAASQDVPLAGDVASVSCAGAGTCAVINPTEGAVGVAG